MNAPRWITFYQSVPRANPERYRTKGHAQGKHRHHQNDRFQGNARVRECLIAAAPPLAYPDVRHPGESGVRLLGSAKPNLDGTDGAGPPTAIREQAPNAHPSSPRRSSTVRPAPPTRYLPHRTRPASCRASARTSGSFRTNVSQSPKLLLNDPLASHSPMVPPWRQAEMLILPAPTDVSNSYASLARFTGHLS